MQINMYSIFDVASETFGQPFLMNTDTLAARSFYEASQNPSTPIHKYPQEYVLYKVGSFDEDEGMLHPQEPKRLMSAAHARKIFTPNEPENAEE